MKLIEHVPPLSEQLVPEPNVPKVAGVAVQLTLPDGVPCTPTGLVSVTVAVHVVVLSTSIGLGAQTTRVRLVRCTVSGTLPELV